MTTDQAANSAIHCTAAGGNAVVSRVVAQLDSPKDLQIDGDHVYWAATDGIYGAVISADAAVQTIASQPGADPWGLDVDAEAVYWVSRDGAFKIAKPLLPSQ